VSGFRAIPLRRIVGLAAVVFTAMLVAFVLQIRPDYLRPTELGTETSTYLGAGQRLLAGHDLYALSPGDRPMPVWPPFWTVPLVGPPTTAVLWLPLAALLPAVVASYAWWLAALVSTVAVYVRVALGGPLPAAISALLLSFSVAITALSGNVNGLLIGGLSAVWFLSRRPASTRRDIAIGLVIAAAAAVKIGPAVFGLWLLGQRRWGAVVATIVSGLAIAGITILAVGLDTLTAYLDLARDTAAGGMTAYSAGGILESLGAPHSVAVAAPFGVIILTAILALALRRHPRASFAVVAVGATFAVPVVRLESLAFLLVAMIPWTRPVGLRPRVRAGSGSRAPAPDAAGA
jgi:alpha-1,2-mannosyltransferase